MAEKVVADKRIDIFYFSWRGATKRVAEWIAGSLSSYRVRLVEIKPLRDHSYIVWLILSFIPGLGVKSRFEPPQSKVIFLCLPKWTLNCPPVTYFLKKASLSGRVVFLAITYGGFDEKRYASSLKERIRKLGAKVGGTILVKRRHIEENPEMVRKMISEWAAKCILNLKKDD